MFRAWSKIVVASLVILGMDAIASESGQRTNENLEASNKSVALLHPDIPDKGNSVFTPKIGVACASRERPCISLDNLIVAAVAAPALDALKYNPFNPRAPPDPANPHT